MTVKDKIFSFNESEWVFERSSGYPGERNSKTGEWIFEREYSRRKRLKKEYEEMYQLIHEFRRDHLPFGLYGDNVIQTFLETKFEEKSKKEENYAY